MNTISARGSAGVLCLELLILALSQAERDRLYEYYQRAWFCWGALYGTMLLVLSQAERHIACTIGECGSAGVLCLELSQAERDTVRIVIARVILLGFE